MGGAVLVKVGFVAVALAVGSITALQEPRGLTAWESNQRKRAAAKAGRSNTGRGVAA